MHCPTCGSQLTDTLSYCNRCGANLRAIKQQSPIKPRGVDSLVGAMVFNTIALLGMILGALVLIKGAFIGETVGMAFVFLSLLALLVIDGLLIRQLRRINKGYQERNINAQSTVSKEEIGSGRARTLPQPVESMQSVTEHTTRTLEPIYRNGESS